MNIAQLYPISVKHVTRLHDELLTRCSDTYPKEVKRITFFFVKMGNECPYLIKSLQLFYFNHPQERAWMDRVRAECET